MTTAALDVHAATPAAERPDPNGRNGFDFLFGQWTVRHRRLKTIGEGADEWYEFEGLSTCEPRLGGLANLEEHRFHSRGERGLALRFFEPATGSWFVYWANDRDGMLQPPVQGRFDGPGCVLEGEDVHAGRPIRVRYVWSRTDTEHPIWEQFFSWDGENWERNWVMEFRPAD